jgi:hypothetical protein
MEVEKYIPPGRITFFWFFPPFMVGNDSCGNKLVSCFFEESFEA